MSELLYTTLAAQLIALTLIAIFSKPEKKDVNKWLSEI